MIQKAATKSPPRRTQPRDEVRKLIWCVSQRTKRDEIIEMVTGFENILAASRRTLCFHKFAQSPRDCDSDPRVFCLALQSRNFDALASVSIFWIL